MIKDISGASINEFVEQILFKELKVFDTVAAPSKKEKASATSNKLPTIIEKAGAGGQITTSQAEDDEVDQKQLAEEQEKQTLEQSLKILKVLNFLFTNQDLISEKGIRFIMKDDISNIEDSD